MITDVQTECHFVKVRIVSANGYTQELRKMQWRAPQQEQWNCAPEKGRSYARRKGRLEQGQLEYIDIDLEARIQNLFQHMNLSQLKMQCIDDDGDWVTLDTDAELDTALLAQKVRPLVIIVHDCDKAGTLSDSAKRRIMKDSGIPIAAVKSAEAEDEDFSSDSGPRAQYGADLIPGYGADLTPGIGGKLYPGIRGRFDLGNLRSSLSSE